MERFIYLNNSGSKWRVVDENGRNIRLTWKTKSGKSITRAVKIFSQWGQHAVCSISYKGRQKEVFTDTVLKD